MTIRRSNMAKIALEGGPKAKKHPYGWGKRYGKGELKELREALESGTLFYHSGTKVKKMCRKFGDMIKSKHCVAASSGTAALHVALGTLGVGMNSMSP